MAIRVCKGKYNIIKDNKIDYTFLETDDNNKFIIATDKNQVPKYYIYKDNKIYDKFINLEDIYISGKNILKELKIDYLPVLKDNKIYGFIFDDDYLNDALNKIKELIVVSEKINIFKFKYDEAIIYGYNELTYYLEKLFKINNLPYQIITDGQAPLLNDNKKYFILYVEGNLGLTINECAFWKVHEEWLFESIKPLYKIYNEINLLDYNKNSMDKIVEMIADNKPLMIARVGNTELAIVKEYLQKQINLIDNYDDFWLNYLFSTSGFFAKKRNNDIVDKFAIEHIESIKKCDCNLLYGNDELAEGLRSTLFYIQNEERNKIKWDDVATPYNKFISAFKNKKILVISPYSTDIKKQLNNIKNVYGDTIYDNITFETYQSVETQLNNTQGFVDYFDALNKMKEDIKKIDFDIALVCCGAYGYLLSSYIKDIGKIAIELCSYLPNWFGIKIKRYCTNLIVNKIWNSYWIFPTSKKILKSEKIEDNCYWE